jgi:hypothetical protein
MPLLRNFGPQKGATDSVIDTTFNSNGRSMSEMGHLGLERWRLQSFSVEDMTKYPEAP